jgi:hypothetical protein
MSSPAREMAARCQPGDESYLIAASRRTRDLRVHRTRRNRDLMSGLPAAGFGPFAIRSRFRGESAIELRGLGHTGCYSGARRGEPEVSWRAVFTNSERTNENGVSNAVRAARQMS